MTAPDTRAAGRPKLTAVQRQALNCMTSGIWKDPTQIGEGIPEELQHLSQLWSGLARRGLLETFRNSEQVRGERRVYWVEYRITLAGRIALSLTNTEPRR